MAITGGRGGGQGRGTRRAFADFLLFIMLVDFHTPEYYFTNNGRHPGLHRAPPQDTQRHPSELNKIGGVRRLEQRGVIACASLWGRLPEPCSAILSVGLPLLGLLVMHHTLWAIYA